MRATDLKPLKEVADYVQCPAHRIIHLCEQGVVEPVVAARGRGSVRRFNRNNIFRILLALDLQELGLQIGTMTPLMQGLDDLLQVPEIQQLQEEIEDYDLPAVIDHLGDYENPCLAFLTAPAAEAQSRPVHLYLPKLKTFRWQMPAANLIVPTSRPPWGHFVGANLTIPARLFF